jgi:ankyrin repeat protein
MLTFINKTELRNDSNILFQTPLHDVVREGKGDVVEILLQNGANVNEKNVKIISLGENI